MAEVIGLAASIIQIAGAGTKLSVALYNFTTSAARADQDIRDIADDVELTSNALESVGKVFESEDSKSIVSKKAIQDANNIIKKCEGVFNEVSEMVEKRRKLGKDGKKGLSVMGKLSWPMKEQRVELYRRRLESLKNSLVLLLHVLQLAQGQARGKMETSVMQEEREKIRELHQRQQDSLKSLQALENRFCKVGLDDEETLQGSSNTSRVPTLELMLGPNSMTLPPLDKNRRANADTMTIDLPADGDPETSYSDTTVTDDENDEHLSLDELAKCATHVQRLLKHINQLQQTFHISQKSSPHRKRRVHKMYQRFRQKFELDLKVVPPPPQPLPIPVPPPQARASPVDLELTFGESEGLENFDFDSFLSDPNINHNREAGFSNTTFHFVPQSMEPLNAQDPEVFSRIPPLTTQSYRMVPSETSTAPEAPVMYVQPQTNNPPDPSRWQSLQQPYLPGVTEEDWRRIASQQMIQMGTSPELQERRFQYAQLQRPMQTQPTQQQTQRPSQTQTFRKASPAMPMLNRPIVPPHQAAGQMRPPSGNPTQPQNHALEDYHMQLALLEQQNKKRLLMARQEQADDLSLDAGGVPAISEQSLSPEQQHAPEDYQRQLALLEQQNKQRLLMARQEQAISDRSLPPEQWHAPEDYQMQLMLLEQQNKKRLLMARQEQADNLSLDAGGVPVISDQSLPPEQRHAPEDYHRRLALLEQQNKKRLLMARQEQTDDLLLDAGGVPAISEQSLSPEQQHAPEDYQRQLALLEQQNKQRLLMARQEQAISDQSLPPEQRHAPEDYQMQLMLLEQQNKKRLLMARQEQAVSDQRLSPEQRRYPAVLDRTAQVQAQNPPFICHVPGCGKCFHRKDLLLRHQERQTCGDEHNQEDRVFSHQRTSQPFTSPSAHLGASSSSAYPAPGVVQSTSYGFEPIRHLPSILSPTLGAAESVSRKFSATSHFQAGAPIRGPHLVHSYNSYTPGSPLPTPDPSSSGRGLKRGRGPLTAEQRANGRVRQSPILKPDRRKGAVSSIIPLKDAPELTTEVEPASPYTAFRPKLQHVSHCYIEGGEDNKHDDENEVLSRPNIYQQSLDYMSSSGSAIPVPTSMPRTHEPFPTLSQSVLDFSHADEMSSPEITVDFAPPSRQVSFEPPTTKRRRSTSSSLTLGSEQARMEELNVSKRVSRKKKKPKRSEDLSLIGDRDIVDVLLEQWTVTAS